MSRVPSNPSPRPRRGYGASLLGWALLWLVGTSAIAGVGATRYAPYFERLMRDDVQRRVAPLADAPIAISVRDHEATLSGSVADASSRDALLAAAATGIGIRSVVDRITLRGTEPVAPTGQASTEQASTRREERSGDPGEDPPAADSTAPGRAGTDAAEAGENAVAADVAPSAEPGALAREATADGTSAEESIETATPATDVAPSAGTEVLTEEAGTDEPPADENAETATPATDVAPSAGTEVLAEEAGTDEPPADENAETATPAPDVAPSAGTEVLAEEAGTDEPPADENAETATPAPDVVPSAGTGALAGEAEGGAADTGATAGVPTRVALAEPVTPASAESATDEEGGAAPADAFVETPSVVSSRVDGDDEAGSPTLRLDVFERVLTVNGTLSVEDNPAELVATTMDVFDLDYVSNGIEMTESVAVAGWLQPVVALLPELARLEAPGIEVLGRRVTLRGEAPDRATHDGIVAAALERLEGYALVERIDVVPPGGEDAPTVADVETDVDDGTLAPVEASAGGDGDGGPTAAEETESSSTVIAMREETRPRPEIDREVPTEGAAAALRAALATLPDLDVRFRSDSATLDKDSRARLDAVAGILMRHPDVRVAIDGHTDSAGPSDENLRLSQARANAVRDYLVARGVSVYRLAARGFGEELPIADNATAEGRAANRRIEFNY